MTRVLGRNPMALVGTCDWVTKKWLLDAFAESEGLDWEKADDRAWLQSQDLEYHNIDPDEGLYLLLEGQGQVRRLIEDRAVVRAMVQAPEGTRAWFRGHCMDKFGAAVRTLNWDSIEVECDGSVVAIDLKACVDVDTAYYYNQILEEVETIEELVGKLSSERR